MLRKIILPTLLVLVINSGCDQTKSEPTPAPAPISGQKKTPEDQAHNPFSQEEEKKAPQFSTQAPVIKPKPNISNGPQTTKVKIEDKDDKTDEKDELVTLLKSRPLDLSMTQIYPHLKDRYEAIYDIKSKNTECYLEIAKQRLKTPDYISRLSAMERADNPRPLVFNTDKEWEEFKNDIKDLLKPFNNPQAYAQIIGSSTTFFSENPMKSSDDALKMPYPACVAPTNIGKIYTFNTPGEDPSDLDINLLIPELSDLCNKAGKNKYDQVFNGMFDICFAQSPNNAIRALSDNVLRNFRTKWMNKLGIPDVSFAIRILPDHRLGTLREPGVMNFDADPSLKRGFNIAIRD